MKDLTSLVISVGQRLTAHHLKLVTAESCTGGLLAKAITDVAGASAFFERGFIVYSELSKQELLGVEPKTLTQFGAVSQETVSEMVAGALERSPAEIGIAVTGIAGPQGGTPAVPIGSVWLAWASRFWPLTTKAYQFSGSRINVRDQCVLASLKELEALLAQHF